MEVRVQRPQLVSLRVTSFHGDNTALANPPQSLQLELSQDIQLGLGVSTDPGKRLLAMVNVPFLTLFEENGKRLFYTVK